ncbi:BTAD domain-containing putative transcriptional regulator [Rhizocola hellebori]|uniref:BTAD domain-containing putative transcriptional regulator n=1 Tax=Rhizocola hellebori TaxID=1392758 RepID=UPI001940F1D5|nr:BTAD domain-containing putative transcriptional regulator [Rhizocola hellebori]
MKISLLGPVEVRADDGSLLDLGGARLRTLLIRLALEPRRTVSHDALVDAVWADEPPANSSNALQQLVSRLRRRGLPIHADSAGYRLELAESDIDIFSSEPTGPWRGPALAEVADRDFARAHLTRLSELRAQAAEETATTIGDLEALAAEHPLRERPVELLMRALWRLGRPAEALAAFERYRDLVAEQLGADPSPALAALNVEILRGQQPDRPSLPVALTSFVGRDGDLSQLRELLGTTRLVTLTGPGGSGKTRLALETARLLAAQPAGGDAAVRLVELAPLGEAVEVPTAILAALGIREHTLLIHRGVAVDAQDPIDRVIAALSHRRLLLILDNCEHLLDPVARVAEAVLTTCPGVTVLATSREPLGLIGETLWPVEPLPGLAAVAMLTDRARAVKPGFDAEADELDRLCLALDRMPLAIELAAARLRTLSLHQLTSRIDERFRLLTGGSRTALPRHQTLRAVVDWSWDLCDEQERAVWRALSVFHGGATLGAIEAVAGAEAFDHLSGLVDKSLVNAEGERYSMLETIREYGLDRLGPADRAALEGAHAAYFAELAEQAEPHLRESTQIEWLAVLRADHDNLHAALRRRIAARDTATAIQLVAGLGWYWWLSGYRAEGSSLAAEALALPEAGEPSLQRRAIALTMAALNVIDGRGDMVRAKEWFQQASALVTESGPAHPLLKMVQPTTLLASWDLASAPELLPAYRVLFADPDPWVAATARAFHAHTLVNIGQTGPQAKADFETALALYRTVGDRWGMSLALEALSMMEAQEGDFAASAQRALEADGLLTVLGTSEDLLQLRLRLAQAQWFLGDTDGSIATIAAAERQAEKLGSSFGRAATAFAWASYARLQGDFVKANRLLCKAAELIDTDIVAPQFRAIHAGAFGLVAAAEGDFDLARRQHTIAVETAIASADAPVIGYILVGCADLSLREGDPLLAATLLGAAEAMNGAVDHSILDRPRIDTEVRAILGEERFVAAYRRGLAATIPSLPKLTGLPLSLSA